MLKDIPKLVVENIIIAVVHELNDESVMVWNVYVVNLYDTEIKNVLVSSRGYGTFEGREVKTSELRHLIGDMSAKDFAKIEPIMPNLFGLANEFWISFTLGKNMLDKKYVFVPESICEENFTLIPLLNKRGVMIR
jgi:hypothetical protein